MAGSPAMCPKCMPLGRRHSAVLGLLLVGSAALACRDPSRFSTHGDSFTGTVVQSAFVRTGIAENVQLCLTLDTDHLLDGPGVMTSSDGSFQSAPLRPIPQIWHDPLSTLAFGEGRDRNLVYMATPQDGVDVTVIVSLMREGNIEVRLLRGAPAATRLQAGEADATAPLAGPLFAVFDLNRQAKACP